MALETTFIEPRKGTTRAVVNLAPDVIRKFKEDPNIKSIETSKGQKIKEDMEQGSSERLRELSSEVGKTLVKVLKKGGDEISRATVKDRTESSFKVYVQYITNQDDEFNFSIGEDNKLHLSTGEEDKILSDVGEESGTLKIEKTVLEDALESYIKELQQKVITPETKPEEDSEDLVALREAETQWKKGKSKDTAKNLLKAMAKVKGPDFVREIQGRIQGEEGKSSKLDKLHKIQVPVEQADKALDILTDAYGSRFLPMNPPGTFYFGKKSEAIEAGRKLREIGLEVEGKGLEEEFEVRLENPGFEGEPQSENPTTTPSSSSDTVVFDIPLFIRILEYVREDVKDDVEIHTITQQAIQIGSRGSKTLTMKDYDSLVGGTQDEG